MPTSALMKGGYKEENKNENKANEKDRQITKLPNQRLEGVKLYETRILLNAVDDQRRDESGKNLEQVREKGHGALVLRGSR